MTPNEMARRIRHDLIKHLDIPEPERELDVNEAHVLIRRLFDSGTGISRLGAVWGFKLRRDEGWKSELETPLCAIEQACTALARREAFVRKNLMMGGYVDAETLRMLHQVVDAVHQFEDVCTRLAPDENDDALAALDFFDLTVPSHEESGVPQMDTSQTSKQDTKEQKNSGDERYTLLVVDDHLMSIDRLQAHPTFRKRFKWLTRCDKTCECLQCPDRESCQLRRARTYQETVEALSHAQNAGQSVDALLMDIRFDDLNDADLLWLPEIPALNTQETVQSLQGLLIARQLRRMPEFRHIPVVLMTARSRLPKGAARLLEGLEGLQFVDDDDSLDALAARLESVVKLGHEAPIEQGYFWGTSPKIQHARRQIEIMSLGPRTVFITGPSGAGKSSLVEHIIYPLSGRKNLVTLDLSSVPDTLVESELFGHVKGAYSGATSDRTGLIEEADGGILFLDEIGNLSLENQRKLLLFLQDKMVRRVGAAHETRKHVDVKVVAATHLDLSAEVAAGRFRFDLYMRLGPAMRIELPSIAERREDLPAFVETLVLKILQGDEMRPEVDELVRRNRCTRDIEVDYGTGTKFHSDGICVRFKPATRELFHTYHWPGNTRELESVLDTLILKALYDLRIADSSSRIIEIDHFYAMSLLGGIESVQTENTELPLSADKKLELGRVADFAELRQQLERTYLCRAFDLCKGDLGRMGQELFGDDSPQMQHKIAVRMNQLGLSIKKLKKG